MSRMAPSKVLGPLLLELVFSLMKTTSTQQLLD